MNDTELDRLIAGANPYGDYELGQLPADDDELLEEIIARPAPVREKAPRIRRPRKLLVAAAAVLVTAGIGAGGAVFPHGNPAAPTSAYAAERLAVAEANQRVLLDEPGWKVDRVGQFSKESGQMRLTDNRRWVVVSWIPTSVYSNLMAKHAWGATKEPIDVLGQRGAVFHSIGTTSGYTTILPPKGVNFLEVSSNVGSEVQYRALVAKLRTVDVKTWLDALPATVVQESDRPREVSSFLANLTVPAGFNPESLQAGGFIERYDLYWKVNAAVACVWLDQWTVAKQTGNTAVVQQASAAMTANASVARSSEVRTGLAESYRGSWALPPIRPYADLVTLGKIPVGYRERLGC